MQRLTVSTEFRSCKTHRTYNHQYVSSSSYQHTETNLHRRRRFLALLGQSTEDSDRYRSQSNHEASVELLEDRSADAGNFWQCAVLVNQTCNGSSDNGSRDTLTLTSLALEQTEQTVNDEDTEYQVHYVECHALDTSRRCSGIVTGKECQSCTVLVECHPEEDNYSKYQAETYDTFLGLSRSQFFYILSTGSCSSLLTVCVSKCTTEDVVDSDRSNQRKTSYTESIVIRISFAYTE